MARNFWKEKEDKLGEQIVHRFLLEHFYLDIAENKETMESDIISQFKGIDTFFYCNGKKYKCDEKAALDWANRGYLLTTFCLELSCLNRKDELMEGWFTDDSMENNSYLFVWIDKSTSRKITCPDDIIEADIMLIWKQDIYDYLASKGWTKDKLREKDKLIRSHQKTDAPYGTTENLGDIKKYGLKFSICNKKNDNGEYIYPEVPINLLLSRDIYKSMPNTIYKKYIKS